MQLLQIARYPVKSMRGEILPSAEVELSGVRGDRCWGVRDQVTGRILTARRAPQLLFATATLTSDGTPQINLPTGVICEAPGADTDAALSDWLGKPVSLVSSIAAPAGRAEAFADATDDTSEAFEWTMPDGRYVDAAPLLVLTTASLRAAAALHVDGNWDLRRFRANLVVDVDEEGWVEDAWCGRALVRVGDAELVPQVLCMRCTMVTRRQPDLDEDRDIFRVLARNHGGQLGAWATVNVGGTVSTGDAVHAEIPLAEHDPDVVS